MVFFLLTSCDATDQLINTPELGRIEKTPGRVRRQDRKWYLTNPFVSKNLVNGVVLHQFERTRLLWFTTVAHWSQCTRSRFLKWFSGCSRSHTVAVKRIHLHWPHPWVSHFKAEPPRAAYSLEQMCYFARLKEAARYIPLLIIQLARFIAGIVK